MFGHVVQKKIPVLLEKGIVTTMMNVLVNLHVEVITVLDPHIHHLRIVVKIHHQQQQQPLPLQQPQLRVIIF